MTSDETKLDQNLEQSRPNDALIFVKKLVRVERSGSDIIRGERLTSAFLPCCKIYMALLLTLLTLLTCSHIRHSLRIFPRGV